jgi:beta-glucosidase
MPLYGPSNAAACIKAGNDLLMPGSKEDVEEILASVDAEEGTVKYPITLEELRGCAERILRIIAKSNTYTEES